MEKKPIDRVKIIIEDENLSISAFEKACGLSNNSIQTAIKRRTNLKDETLNSILKAFPKYSPAWILVGEGEKLREHHYYIQSDNVFNVSESKSAYGNKMPIVITVDSQNRDNIPLVPVKARAGYLDGYYKPEFVRNLPVYRMPGLNNGTFRMFQMKGQSMNLTIPDQSFAVGEFVENWDTGIKDDRVYIVVTSDWDRDEEGVLIKRCLNRIKKYNNLMCKSDNLDRRSYPTKNIDPSTILEVWEVKGAFIINIPNPSPIFERMNDLESEMEEIKRKIN